MERKNRQPMPELDPKERGKNFMEVTSGYTLEMAQAEAARCMNCKNAPCKGGCPVAIDIPAFLAKVAGGDILAAGEIINKTSSLAAVCGRVCPQEIQCEKNCLRAKIDGAVAIGAVERFVGDYMLRNSKTQKIEGKGHRVAVVGSGPAGLSCAAQLQKNGVSVTIFEAFHKAGGVLTYGIPEFRLPKDIVDAEIKQLTDMGVEIVYNTVAGKTITIDELREQYDAVFLGSGAGLPQFMNIKGENLNGVYSANEYLTRVNLMKAYLEGSDTPVQKGKNVVVIGAGNVAMDASRTALRLGADKVTIVYRRTKTEMPARGEEIEHAIAEGINLELLCAPIEIIGENGWVKEIKCERMRLGEADSSGRRAPIAIEGSEFSIATDMVIVALGTSPNPLIKNAYKAIETTKKGTIVVDDNLMTSEPGIWAGGDAVTGAATVILAMGAGRKAAHAIMEYLGV